MFLPLDGLRATTSGGNVSSSQRESSTKVTAFHHNHGTFDLAAWESLKLPLHSGLFIQSAGIWAELNFCGHFYFWLGLQLSIILIIDYSIDYFFD